MITLSEAKAQLRVELADDDTRILALIKATIGHIEDKTNRIIDIRTKTITLDGFGCFIEIPFAPFKKITEINYLDSDGVEQTLHSNAYRVDTRKLFAVVHPVYGGSWPEVSAVPESVTVTCEVGYDFHPEALKLAGLLLIEHWYYDTGADMKAVESLVSPYRVYLG